MYHWQNKKERFISKGWDWNVFVLPQMDGADVSLNAGSGAQHFATVLPEALEHHLHGVLRKQNQQIKKEEDTTKKWL